jgi:hypothetical protein
MEQAETKPFPLPLGLEMDIAHACNLHCRSCTHYSDYGLKGVVALSDGARWLGAVAKRLAPKSLHLLGGEPTLNPQLCDFIWVVRDLFPEAEVGVVSNGLLLDRHPDLWETLEKTKATLEISRHSLTDRPYLDRFEPAIAAARQQAERHGVHLIIREGYSEFYATYRGEGPSMRPFTDGSAKKSWDVCNNKYCMTLHQGTLWKCPPIAFLGRIADKFGLDKVEEWRPYLAYEALDVEASMRDYAAFVTRNYAPESVCTMCPTTLEFHEHTDVTSFTKYPKGD